MEELKKDWWLKRDWTIQMEIGGMKPKLRYQPLFEISLKFRSFVNSEIVDDFLRHDLLRFAAEYFAHF